MFVARLGGVLVLRIVQLLLTPMYPRHARMTAAQVKDVLQYSALRQEACYPVAAQLLLYLQQAGGSAAEALTGARANDPAAMRVALLQAWAAATAGGDAGREATAADEQGLAAASAGFREMLLGLAAMGV
jgi:hypothetical protein